MKKIKGRNLPKGWMIEPFTSCIARSVSFSKLKILQRDFQDKGEYANY